MKFRFTTAASLRVIGVGLIGIIVLVRSYAYTGEHETRGLAAELAQRYKLATPKLGLNGSISFEPGIVLAVQKAGIVSFAEKDAPYTTLCASEFRRGGMHTPRTDSCTTFAPKTRRILQAGERVCVLSIDVATSYDEVTFFIADCGLDRSEHHFASYRAKVIFWFSEGYLTTAPAAKIEDVIDLVLSERAAKASPAVKPSGVDAAQTAQAATDSTKPVAGIATGQTMEQVQGKLGKPSSISEFGLKTVYVYPNLTVVFVDGKVALIQEF